MGDDEAFEAVVLDAASALSAAVVRYDSAGEVELSGVRLAGTVDLRNVRQLCAQVERDRWPEIVLDHLSGLATLQMAPRAAPTLQQAQPLLRSRLYGEAELALTDAVVRPLAPGLVEALVLLEGGAIATLSRPAVQRWGVATDDLFARGRAQVRGEGLLETRPVDVGGVTLTALEGTSFFTTTHLFWLAAYLALPPDGVLVAVPNRHLLLAWALDGPDVLDAAQALLVNADRFHQQGPGSLSPHLYWWHDERLTLLPAAVEPERVTFRPPAEFIPVIERLTG